MFLTLSLANSLNSRKRAKKQHIHKRKMPQSITETSVHNILLRAGCIVSG